MRPVKTQISLGIHPVWSVFIARMKKPRIRGSSLSARRRLWSDWADSQADMRLRRAHKSFCLLRLICFVPLLSKIKIVISYIPCSPKLSLCPCSPHFSDLSSLVPLKQMPLFPCSIKPLMRAHQLGKAYLATCKELYEVWYDYLTVEKVKGPF